MQYIVMLTPQGIFHCDFKKVSNSVGKNYIEGPVDDSSQQEV